MSATATPFRYMSVLKEARYFRVMRGTMVRGRVELDRGKPRVAEVLEIDPSSARPGERADPAQAKDLNSTLATHDLAAALLNLVEYRLG
jgi:hypothetical protein